MSPIVWYWHSADYWQEQLQQLAEWARRGYCGSVVGLTGSGVASLLNLIVRQPQLLRQYQPASQITLVPIALDATTLNGALYPDRLAREFLQALFEARTHFPEDVRQDVVTAYRDYAAVADLYLVQVAIRQLFFRFQEEQVRIIMVMERFDLFCDRVTDEWAHWLTTLRETFPNELCYFAGMRNTRRHVRQTISAGMLYRLVDSHSCWIGGLTPFAAAQMVETEAGQALGTADNHKLLALTGHFPMLIHVACNWWSFEEERLSSADWLTSLLEYPAMDVRLRSIWGELTYREKALLTNLELVSTGAYKKLIADNHIVIHALARKGVCHIEQGKWRIASRILAAYAENARFTVRGKVWFNPKDDTYYQGKEPLEKLSPRAEAALEYFLDHPYKKCDKDALINHIWETPYVTDDSVYQVIRELRRYLEPDSNNPVYIINHRSVRGGRYQFFPEGRPKHYQNNRLEL